MFHKAAPSIAIYDECYPCAQALHNSFKRLGFNQLHLSRDENELSRTLELKPALLLFHLDSSREEALSLTMSIKSKYNRLKLIALTKFDDETHRKQLYKNGADAVMAGSSDLDAIIDKIISLEPSFDIKSEELIISNGTFLKISVSDPFYKILREPKMLRLTALLANGNSTKEIAVVMDHPESDIEKFRKKIIHETNCKNTVEYIAKAKDRQII